jgi:predicted metal-binding protein
LHIQQLVTKAGALGADRAAPLPARAVMVDERVNLKCRVPLCSHYGVNLMCPPNAPTAAETRAALARYSDTLVVQQDMPMTQAAAYEERLRESQNEFARLMTALEAEAFRMGYRFAAAFAGGDCVLCDVCAGADGQPCNHPFEARPSMEAVGVDVVATAAAAGLAVELPAHEHPRWTGLLLID